MWTQHFPKCLWQNALPEAEELAAIPQVCTQAGRFPTTMRSDFLSETRQSSDFHLWTFSSALLWRFTKKNWSTVCQNAFLEQTHPDRQLRRCLLTARLASRYIHNGSWGSHWWSHILKSAFSLSLLFPDHFKWLVIKWVSTDRFKHPSWLTLPKTFHRKIKTNLISLEIAAAVKEMSRF